MRSARLDGADARAGGRRTVGTHPRPGYSLAPNAHPGKALGDATLRITRHEELASSRCVQRTDLGSDELFAFLVGAQSHAEGEFDVTTGEIESLIHRYHRDPVIR